MNLSEKAAAGLQDLVNQSKPVETTAAAQPAAEAVVEKVEAPVEEQVQRNAEAPATQLIEWDKDEVKEVPSKFDLRELAKKVGIEAENEDDFVGKLQAQKQADPYEGLPDNLKKAVEYAKKGVRILRASLRLAIAEIGFNEQGEFPDLTTCVGIYDVVSRWAEYGLTHKSPDGEHPWRQGPGIPGGKYGEVGPLPKPDIGDWLRQPAIPLDATALSKASWMELDLTVFIRERLLAGEKEINLLLRSSTLGRNFTFHSREAQRPELRPQLVVEVSSQLPAFRLESPLTLDRARLGQIQVTAWGLANTNTGKVRQTWRLESKPQRADWSNVVVTEIDPLKALEAVMDGFRVMPMVEAAPQADFICTVTGDKNVVDKNHFEMMKNGCCVANSGHFNVEINIPALEAIAVEKHTPRAVVEEYQLADGRVIRLLGEGRLVNLAAAEGHPAAVMDMSFANQAMASIYIFQNGQKLENKVYSVPDEIDREIARFKLESMGIKIDVLTREQETYLNSWQEGT